MLDTTTAPDQQITQLVVLHEGRSLPVAGHRSMRLLLTCLALLPQIEGMPQGKLTLCWGASDAGIKWSIESFGRDKDLVVDGTS